MKLKLVLLFYYIFFTILLAFSKDVFTFGITEPFLFLNNAETVFLSKQFPFELIFSNEKENLKFIIIREEDSNIFSDYIKTGKKACLQEGYNFYIASNILLKKGVICFDIKLIDPYSNKILFSSFFTKDKDTIINEFLSDVVKKTLSKIANLKLENYFLKNKKIENEEKEFFSLYKNERGERYRHEIFLLNGFFKNHSLSFSFFDLNIGYNFFVVDYFCIESGFFGGIGNFGRNINFYGVNFSNQYIGSFFSFYLFYPFFVEPRAGLRFEVMYLFKNSFAFSFPIDFGIKFYVDKRNIIKLSTSFQFISLVFGSKEAIWKKDFLLGVMIGYAIKIY